MASARVSKALSPFLNETPGLVIGRRVPAMGVRGIPETDVTFSDMEVAADIIVIFQNSALKKALPG